MSSGEAPPANPAPSRPRGIPPHREWESFEDRKEERFPVPWVADNPTIEERRTYMGAYLNWMVKGCVGSEKQARKKAEEVAVTKLAQEGKTEVKTTVFEWAVDRSYWDLWFDSVSVIIGQCPPCPWGRPEEGPNESCSETFARILGQRHNKEQEKQRQQQQQQPQGFKRERSDSADEPQDSQRRRPEAPAEE